MDSFSSEKGFYVPCLLCDVPSAYSFRFSPFDVSPEFFHSDCSFSLDEHFVTCLSCDSSPLASGCLCCCVSSFTLVYVYVFGLSDYRSFRQSVLDRFMSILLFVMAVILTNFISGIAERLSIILRSRSLSGALRRSGGRLYA